MKWVDRQTFRESDLESLAAAIQCHLLLRRANPTSARSVQFRSPTQSSIESNGFHLVRPHTWSSGSRNTPSFSLDERVGGQKIPLFLNVICMKPPHLPLDVARLYVCMYCPPPRSLPILRIVRDIPDGQGSMDSVRLQQNWEYRAPLIGGPQVA